MSEIKILTTEASAEYELLDSGNGEKLERYGKIILSRPDPQALWQKHLPASAWQDAHGHFERAGEKGTWNMKQGTPEKWTVNLAGLEFLIKPAAFKHTGLFPEQVQNWQWIEKIISGTLSLEKNKDQKITVLNLFAYTGGATLAAAKAGAEVVHVDGSKSALNWASENAKLSGLSEKPIRWILDDARAFVTREIKRGKKYDGIIMDPPTFGRGAKGEVWKIEDDLPELLDLCKRVMTEKPLFFLINGYAAGYSSVAYHALLRDFAKDNNFSNLEIESGELCIKESKGSRLLPAGIFARWEA